VRVEGGFEPAWSISRLEGSLGDGKSLATVRVNRYDCTIHVEGEDL
jgi:hypothetical protein